ncbi:MAG: hypothetical protein M3O28_03230 [Actinomycetota bacterium]|nr:hypothetical protein [Actinomycetota bacterium]
MNVQPVRLVAQLGAVALTVSLAACSSSSGSKSDHSSSAGASTPTSSATSSPSAPTNTDYTSLLLDAADIPVAGVTKGTAAAPPQGTGATVSFTASGGRTLGDTVLVLPSAGAAKTAAQASVTAAKQSITGAIASDAPIGGGGTAIRGTTASGAVAALVFTEGKALIVLEFDSTANDLVPSSIIQQVATAQDNKIKTGLPS